MNTRLCCGVTIITKHNNNSVALVRGRTIPIKSECRLSGKLMPTFADRGVSRGQCGGPLRPY
jgi:hypothetical protein